MRNYSRKTNKKMVRFRTPSRFIARKTKFRTCASPSAQHITNFGIGGKIHKITSTFRIFPNSEIIKYKPARNKFK